MSNEPSTSQGATQGDGESQTGATNTTAPLLVLKQLDKRYGATHALKAVDLAFEAGEIHAIVGENGAGKSTLIKLLTGVYPRSAGEVFWQGRPVALATPHEAINLGINAVHQEVVLCPHLTVAANLFLGDERERFGLLQHGEMVREAQKILDDIGFHLPAGALLSALTIGQQQLVAAARATTRGTRFLIFDEPTAYLARQEVEQLFALIRRLKAKGITIIYISHRLEEVFQLADRVRAGEVIGLYGLIGAGRSEFVQSLFGRFPKTSGQIFWNGRPVEIRKERDAISLGIALVPESRRSQGLCLNLGVGLNLNLPIYRRLTKVSVINPFAEAAAADRQIRDVRIKAASRDALVSSLSGGNQQKIVVGKWLNHGARLFIFDEPTTGVDVGTKAEIYKLFAKLLKEGAGIILISSYLPEVYDLSDTLHVFRRGRLVATHDSDAVSEKVLHETILTQAIGR
jgi:ribose transport system ATP-binding protein